MTEALLLTEENYEHSYLHFQDRQAGVNLVYDPEVERYFYHAYCFERVLLKDLLSVEFEFLDEALTFIGHEFPTWQVGSFDKTSGCGSCAAK